MAEVLDKDILKALSSGTRQEILKLLSKRPHTASELAKLLNKHVTTVAEHIDALERSGLITKKETGNKWIYYTLAPKGDRLFKPQFYSWTLLLVLSVVGIFAGFGGILNTSFGGSIARNLESAKSYAPLDDASVPSVTNVVQIDLTLVMLSMLIVLGVIGIAISLTKMRTGKSIILER